MINIVHPRTDVKPPMKRVLPMKKTPCVGAGEASAKDAPLDGKTETARSGNHFACSRSDGKTHGSEANKNAADENRNVIEPGSSMFDQLCEMINDLERNITNGTPLTAEREFLEPAAPSEKANSKSREDRLTNQLVPETEQYLGSFGSKGSSYNDILSFLETLDDDHMNAMVTNKLPLDLFEKDEEIYSKGNVKATPYHQGYETTRNPFYDGAREELTTARLQLEEKDATIRLLKDQLKAERKAACEKLEAQKKAQATKSETREAQHRNVVKRHQKFIEQLIAEKRDLTEKCNSLAQRVKEVEVKAQRDLKVAADRHAVELQRAKELCAASEKIRRERWLQARTAKIKSLRIEEISLNNSRARRNELQTCASRLPQEMTVKGLEPEMRSMVEQHQREIQEIRDMHIKELQDVELRVVRRYNQQLEQLRMELMTSHEKTLANEREMISNRYKEKFEEQECQFRAQQENFAEEMAKERTNFARERARREAEKESALEEARLEFQKQTELLKQRHESEARTLRVSLQNEWQMSFENYKREQAEKFRKAEETIRRDCLKERDKAIELAIKRLERESREAKATLQQSFDDTIRNMKDKYETELKALNDSSETQRKELSAMEQRLRETEARFQDTESRLKECSSNLNNANALVARLTEEKNDAKRIARQEIEAEKRELEEKVASLYREIAKIHANTDASIAQLHSRIKLIITQKVLTIKNLGRELQDAKTRCEHLEQMLDQQRKEYILKSV